MGVRVDQLIRLLWCTGIALLVLAVVALARGGAVPSGADELSVSLPVATVPEAPPQVAEAIDEVVSAAPSVAVPENVQPAVPQAPAVSPAAAGRGSQAALAQPAAPATTAAVTAGASATPAGSSAHASGTSGATAAGVSRSEERRSRRLRRLVRRRQSCLQVLPSRERAVLVARAALSRSKPRSRARVAEVLDLPARRVARLERSGYRRLRELSDDECAARGVAAFRRASGRGQVAVGVGPVPPAPADRGGSVAPGSEGRGTRTGGRSDSGDSDGAASPVTDRARRAVSSLLRPVAGATGAPDAAVLGAAGLGAIALAVLIAGLRRRWPGFRIV